MRIAHKSFYLIPPGQLSEFVFPFRKITTTKVPGIDELEGKGILVNSKSIETRYEVITIMDVTLTAGLFSGSAVSALTNFATRFVSIQHVLNVQCVV